MNRSIFYEDWRDCLRAHYLHVIRTNDTNNEASLFTVLRDTGFSDEEIAEMREANSAAEFNLTAVSEISTEPVAESALEDAASLAETPFFEAPVLPEQTPTPLAAADESVPELISAATNMRGVNSAAGAASKPLRQQSLFDGF